MQRIHATTTAVPAQDIAVCIRKRTVLAGTLIQALSNCLHLRAAGGAISRMRQDATAIRTLHVLYATTLLLKLIHCRLPGCRSCESVAVLPYGNSVCSQDWRGHLKTEAQAAEVIKYFLRKNNLYRRARPYLHCCTVLHIRRTRKMVPLFYFVRHPCRYGVDQTKKGLKKRGIISLKFLMARFCC